MKELIVRAINKNEFNGNQPEALISMIYDDLLVILKFIHWSQREGLLKKPFQFTNQVEYLDKCWHQFILHSFHYWNFCYQEFGEYLHHFPEDDSTQSSLIAENENLVELLSEQMTLIEKYLGEEFSNRIFFLYPEILKREHKNEALQ